MDYQYFTTPEFVKDIYFQKWIIDPDADTNTFWEAWLQAFPHKLEEVEEARQLIRDLNFGQNYETNRAMVEVWQRIQAERVAEPTTEATFRVQRFSSWQRYSLQIAAALAGIILLTYIVFRQTRPEPTIAYSTRFGETRLVKLPDGSEVTLNANSRLSFSASWDTDKPREVWLEGEAYFRVQEKKATGQAKFSVHASQITVEVLGTVFNVKDRHKRAQVVLESGKVHLLVEQPGKTRQAITMKPGELAEVEAGNESVKLRPIDTRFYTAWQINKLIFDKTSLSEIATQLEDTYGYTIVFADAGIANKRFSGSMPAQYPDLLLTTLSRLYNLSITRQNNRLTISAKKP